MNVQDLIGLLSKLNPQAEVVISRDVSNYGFGSLQKIEFGVFEVTDYGNDFWVAQNYILNPQQVKAICLYPVDYQEKTKLPPVLYRET